MQKVKRDDLVFIIGGKERGKQGQVKDIFTKGQRVVVQGLNMVKRHQRQQDQSKPGGIIEKEAPLHLSNVKLICPACQKPTRTGARVRSDGVKVRVCRSCSQDID